MLLYRSFIYSIFLLLSFYTNASENCFLAVRNNKVLHQEGECLLRKSPCSTFKIAISLMGYDDNIFINEDLPILKSTDYINSQKECHKPMSPSFWMNNSCVWYSQKITEKLGLKKFQRYINEFDYGNKDISGDYNKNNGLTHSWLTSSLKISPKEQISFLQKLVENKLPVSLRSHELTRSILYIEDFHEDWKLYGKTGCGNFKEKNQEVLQLGWFIGWIKRDNEIIYFANYIELQQKDNYYAGMITKDSAKQKLLDLVKNID
jgi:beta-lactamase class D